jgi:hypothetical protein
VTLIETNAPADTGDTDEIRFKTHLRARVEGQRWAERPDSVRMLGTPLEALILVNPPEKRAEALMGMMFGVALMAIEELAKDSAQGKTQTLPGEKDKENEVMRIFAQKVGFKLKSRKVTGELVGKGKMCYKRSIFFEVRGEEGFYEEEGALTLQADKNPYDYIREEGSSWEAEDGLD